MTPDVRTVLVVEDDPRCRELVTDLLEDAGWTVRHASTGEEGLALALAEPPRLVLLDLGLPGMDGMATHRALRADPRTRHLTIVATTAQAMRGDSESALAAGFDGYVTKPISVRTFVQELHVALARREGAG